MTPPPTGGMKRWPATAPNVAGDPIDETGGLGIPDLDTLPVHVALPLDTCWLIVTTTDDERHLAMDTDTAARLCQDLADALGRQIT